MIAVVVFVAVACLVLFPIVKVLTTRICPYVPPPIERFSWMHTCGVCTRYDGVEWLPNPRNGYQYDWVCEKCEDKGLQSA